MLLSLYLNEICTILYGDLKYMYQHVIKRIFDIAASGIGIAVLSIPMAAIAVAIKIDDPGPVIFKQNV